MTLPLFTPDQDPGPSFLGLLDRLGLGAPEISGPIEAGVITHGTTVLAIHTRDGVVMAGDRRATSGHHISHHSMEKVFPADRHSGVAISGAAGPAMEMVRLFQLQLEHYEKVEGSPLSLEGKANQLSLMVRGNLMAALQYAVQVLKVPHIIVCGHYGCGGIRGAFAGGATGQLRQWLDHASSVVRDHADELAALDGEEAKLNRLVEMNVRD